MGLLFPAVSLLVVHHSSCALLAGQSGSPARSLLASCTPSAHQENTRCRPGAVLFVAVISSSVAAMGTLQAQCSASPPAAAAAGLQCFAVPLVRQLYWWWGIRPITRHSMRRLLHKGSCVVLVPGGVQVRCPQPPPPAVLLRRSLRAACMHATGSNPQCAGALH